MRPLAKIGPMELLEVIGVYARHNFFEIRFKSRNKLAVTNLHSFKTIEEECKTTCNLIKGEKIWVDVSAFKADGSFYNPKNR